jgi:hypothetical protein
MPRRRAVHRPRRRSPAPSSAAKARAEGSRVRAAVRRDGVGKGSLQAGLATLAASGHDQELSKVVCLHRSRVDWVTSPRRPYRRPQQETGLELRAPGWWCPRCRRSPSGSGRYCAASLVRELSRVHPHLISAEPPYNAHLATDAGSGSSTGGLVLARHASPGVCTSLVTFRRSRPHTLYHAARGAGPHRFGRRMLPLVGSRLRRRVVVGCRTTFAR